MTRFTVVCSYADYLAATATVEAETPDQAFEAAIAKVDAAEAWKKSHHSGAPFIVAYAEGGEPPLVVVSGPAPVGGIRVAEGRARIRYVREAGTFTADLYGEPAPHHGQPLVSVVRRADGAPHVTVVGGAVRVRYYEEEAVAPARIEPTPPEPAG